MTKRFIVADVKHRKYDRSVARDPAFPSIRPSTGDTAETELEAVLQELESGDESVNVDWDKLRVLYAPPR